MRMKRYMDKKHIFLLFLLLGVIPACRQSEVDLSHIADPSSRMLESVMQVSDAPAGFVAERNTVWQAPITPTVENGRLVENVGRTLMGDFGKEGYYIRITHALERYEESAPQSMTMDPSKWGFQIPDTFSPELLAVGRNMSASCTKEKDAETNSTSSVVCEVTVSYHHVLSRLFVWGVTAMDAQSINSVLNDLLSKIDVRVRRIDTDD